MNAQALYAFEENWAGLFTAGLVALGLNAPNVNSLPQFQKARPRTEVFVHGFSATQPIQLALITDNASNKLRRITAYKGNLVLTSVTASDAGGKASHSLYRSQVRSVMELDVIRNAINQASQINGVAIVNSLGTATVTSTNPHGYTTGQLVTLETTTFPNLAGTFQITVTGALTFTYASGVNGAEVDTGNVALVVPYGLQWITPSASTLTTKYQEGMESSKLTYQIDFSIQKNAWNFLTLE